MSLQEAVKSLLEIGKRDLSNSKYDSYFNSLKEELDKDASPQLEQVAREIAERIIPKDWAAHQGTFQEVLEILQRHFPGSKGKVE